MIESRTIGTRKIPRIGNHRRPKIEDLEYRRRVESRRVCGRRHDTHVTPSSSGIPLLGNEAGRGAATSTTATPEQPSRTQDRLTREQHSSWSIVLWGNAKHRGKEDRVAWACNRLASARVSCRGMSTHTLRVLPLAPGSASTRENSSFPIGPHRSRGRRTYRTVDPPRLRSPQSYGELTLNTTESMPSSTGVGPILVALGPLSLTNSPVPRTLAPYLPRRSPLQSDARRLKSP